MFMPVWEYVFTFASTFSIVRFGHVSQITAGPTMSSDLQVCFTLTEIGDAVNFM